jgi:hypothetical protein
MDELLATAQSSAIAKIIDRLLMRWFMSEFDFRIGNPNSPIKKPNNEGRVWT